MVYEPKAPVIPYKRTCPFDPAAEYARLREEEPISPVTFELAPREKDGWLITRHDHIRRLSANCPSPGADYPGRACRAGLPGRPAHRGRRLPIDHRRGGRRRASVSEEFP